MANYLAAQFASLADRYCTDTLDEEDREFLYSALNYDLGELEFDLIENSFDFEEFECGEGHIHRTITLTQEFSSAGNGQKPTLSTDAVISMCSNRIIEIPEKAVSLLSHAVES